MQVVSNCVHVDSDYDLDEHEDDKADCENVPMNMMTVYHQEGSRFRGP